jgi:hypothetical protein
VLADDEHRTGHGVAQSGLQRGHERRASADCGQRRDIARCVPDPAERPEELESLTAAPPLLEVADCLRRQRAFELGDDRGDEPDLRLADECFELGRRRDLPGGDATRGETSHDLEQPPLVPVLVAAGEHARDERRLAVTLDRLQEKGQLAGVRPLHSAVGPVEPVGRDLAPQRSGTMGDRRQDRLRRAAKAFDSVERDIRRGEARARAHELRIVAEALELRPLGLEAFRDRPSRRASRRLGVFDRVGRAGRRVVALRLPHGVPYTLALNGAAGRDRC